MEITYNQRGFGLSNGQEFEALELLDSFGFEKACAYLDDEIQDSLNTEQYLKAEIFRQMKVFIVLTSNSN